MQKEIRSFGVESKGRTVSGYAIVFNQKSEILREGGREFREIILPEAVTEALLRGSDIKCFIDHDDRRMIARSNKGKGSLRLSIDKKGLRFSFDAPHTSDGDYAVEMIGRGDVTGCSFSFSGVTDTWTEGVDGISIRKVLKISRLNDVSIVTTPAYPQTTVDVRKLNSNQMSKRSIEDVFSSWSDLFRSEAEKNLLKNKVDIRLVRAVRGSASYPLISGEVPTIDRQPVKGETGGSSARVVKATPHTIFTSASFTGTAETQSLTLHRGAVQEVSKKTAEVINRWILSPTKVVDVEGVSGVFIKKQDSPNVLTFAGDTPTWEEVVSLETLVTSSIDDDGTGLYVVNPTMAGLLKTTTKAAGSPFILEDGKINGHPVFVTNDVPSGFIGFGLFSSVVVNEFDVSDIVTDRLTGATTNKVTVFSNFDADIAVLRDQAFAFGCTPAAHSLIFG